MTSSPQLPDSSTSRTAAEWLTFTVSALLLSLVVALIVVQIPGEHAPPAPVATQAGAVRAERGEFFVPVDVENKGEETAQNVQVLATLTAADGTEIVADQLVDFLAGGEVERVEFVFDDDPREGELEITVSGYSVP